MLQVSDHLLKLGGPLVDVMLQLRVNTSQLVLGGEQLRLSQFALGDVKENAQEFLRPWRCDLFLEHNASAASDPPNGPIGSQNAKLSGADLAQSRVESAGDCCQNAFLVLRVGGPWGDIGGQAPCGTPSIFRHSSLTRTSLLRRSRS